MAYDGNKAVNGNGLLYFWTQVKSWATGLFQPKSLGSSAASKAMVTDSSGNISTSSVTATELGYVSGVTSSIQTQLGDKQGKMTVGTGSAGAVTTLSAGTNISITISSSTATIASTYSYTLPDATDSVKGGVIVGSNINVSSGTISVSDAGTSTKGVMKLYTGTGTATDGTMTQSAITSAISAAAAGAVTFKGTVNTNTDISGLTSWTAGWYWVVETAGTYVGQACEAGDMIYCIATATTYDADNFSVVQNNITFLDNTEIQAIIDAVS